MFDHRLWIFNTNLGIVLRVQFFLKYKLKFNNFYLCNDLVVSFPFICEFQALDIIWLVNLKIYTEVFISGFF